MQNAELMRIFVPKNKNLPLIYVLYSKIYMDLYSIIKKYAPKVRENTTIPYIICYIDYGTF